MSVVFSGILNWPFALSPVPVEVAFVSPSGDMSSLVSRKGFLEIGLIPSRAGLVLLSVTRLRKGLLEAKDAGPRSGFPS